MRKLKEVLLRMAERLFLATVVAGLTKAVATGVITLTAALVMLAAVVLVVVLLIVAYRLPDE